MNLIPKSVSRLAGRGSLHLQKSSPTILVVGGVIGLGATAVLAARATRKLDPILDAHKAARTAVVDSPGISEKDRPRELVRVYKTTGWELTKLYGPSIFIGTASAVAVLGGHKILRARHLATMAAYSGLAEQFAAYRARIVQTLGESAERDIYNGAHGEMLEDPEHPGEYKLGPVWSENGPESPEVYLRPWYNESVPGWTEDPISNEMKLRGLQNHMNVMLDTRGHLFLNEVYDALHLPHTRAGAVVGWLRDPREGGDGYVDFGFLVGTDPNTVDFREGRTPNVQLNFNVDPGIIWDRIKTPWNS